MSFKCEDCKTAQPSGTTPIVAAMETRKKEYWDSGSIGIEIVKEKRICAICQETRSRRELVQSDLQG